MSKAITPNHIRQSNKQQIYDHIYRTRKTSQQDMLYALHLSRPTVSAKLTELESEGLIRKCGTIEADQIGRKATAYAIVTDFRIAIGVEILNRCAKLIAVNLYGEQISRSVVDICFCNSSAYYTDICASINSFVDALPVSRGQILGIGMSLQGLAAPDGKSMVYGKILNCTGLKVDVFENNIHLPCRFVHDPAGAAMSELWVSPALTDAVYLSLSSHPGGAIIADRRIRSGLHGHSATIEHVRAPGCNDLCYCGKRGCWDTLLKVNNLTDGETLESFFEHVRGGDDESVQRWRTYLKNLAGMIALAHLVYDEQYILGGHLAPFITQEDIAFIYDEIRRYCPFTEEDNFIRVSKMPSHNISIGISLPFIRAFLEEMGVDMNRQGGETEISN